MKTTKSVQSGLAILIDSVHKEKGIPKDVLIDLIEQAMGKAARQWLRQNNMSIPDEELKHDIEARYNAEMGEVEIFEFKEIVGTVENKQTQIALEEARNFNPDFEIGDSMGTKLDVLDLGRIAAQTARQYIIQKIRDTEREMIHNEFKDRKGEIISGIVRRFEKGNIIIDLGKTEAILPYKEQVRNETYRIGDAIDAYVLDINRSQPQVVLSRKHKSFLVKLFEREVPEIYEGIVSIQSCARSPGHRSKIAVSSTDESVDPVGACVGLRGSRVQAVVQELRGEAIDIIPFNEDPTRYVIDAIAPATVSKFILDNHNRSIELIVPDEQLSKAIGRQGQNVRLAAQLTGWRIDIFANSRYEAKINIIRDRFLEVQSLKDEQIELLIRNGYEDLVEIIDLEAEHLSMLLEINDEQSNLILQDTDRAIIAQQERERLLNEQDIPEEV